MNTLKTAISGLGYRLIRSGVRLPRSRVATNYAIKAQLYDLLKVHDINCVMDVGANKGWFSASLRPLGFKGDIFSFEPIREDYETVAALTARDPRWHAINCALGDMEETRKFNVVKAEDGHTVLSSFLDSSAGTTVSKENIEIKTVDGLFPTLPFSSKEPRIFLKTDTQGYDINVIRGAARTMDRIKLLQAEIAVNHIYSGAPHYTEALNVFEGLGFGLIDLHPISRTNNGAILEYDCMMGKS